MHKIYFAGPDVFSPDWESFKQEISALCSEFSFYPIFPIDEGGLSSRKIYLANLERIRTSDAIFANLMPFRGIEPDSGTSFEIGFAIGIGKPVFALSPREDMLGRIAKDFGPLQKHEYGWTIRDRNGYGVENFGRALNLMLFESATVCHDLLPLFESAKMFFSGAGDAIHSRESS